MKAEKQPIHIHGIKSPGGFLDLLSGILISGTLAVGLFSAVLFINPDSRINPLPPNKMPELQLAAAPSSTPRPGLPPTWTPTLSPTDAPTEAPPPTVAPTSIVIYSPTPAADLEGEVPSDSQDGQPASVPDVVLADDECSLQGFEGQVYDLDDSFSAAHFSPQSGEPRDGSDSASSLPAEQFLDNVLPPGGGISELFTPEIQYWEDEILAWGEEYGLDPNLIATVMQIESCGYTRAKSAAGALGLFQVMPQHFKKKENPYDPDTNAFRGLSWLQKTINSGDSIRMALAGYNAGIARVKMSSLEWPSETQRYVDWGEEIYQAALCGYEYSNALENWLSKGGSALCSRAAAEQQDQ